MTWIYSTLLRSAVFVWLLLSLYGCGVIQKTKTITKTIFDIDTILSVRLDYHLTAADIPLQKFLAGDTLRAENKTSVAVTYYDVKTQKVELALTGKLFDVPVTLQATKIEKIKETKRKSPFGIYVLAFVAGAVTGAFITYKLKT